MSEMYHIQSLYRMSVCLSLCTLLLIRNAVVLTAMLLIYCLVNS